MADLIVNLRAAKRRADDIAFKKVGLQARLQES